jgi:hypothetical protein
MADKKRIMEKYCRIYLWIEGKDPELAEAIKDLCMEGSLTPHKNMDGITFLMPSKDNLIRKEIVAKAYTADASKAVDLIKSLILMNKYTSKHDFESDRNIGNKLFAKLIVKKDESTDDKIVLYDSSKPDKTVVIKKEPKFIPLDDKKNIAVWNIVSGNPPTQKSGEKEHTYLFDPKKTGGDNDKNKKPSKVVDSAIAKLIHSPRAYIASKVEEEYCKKLRSYTTHLNNPYLRVLITIIKYLHDNYPDEYIKIKCLLDIDPIISFYIILEPYKTDGDYLISNDIINDYSLGKLLSNESSTVNGQISNFSLQLLLKNKSYKNAVVDYKYYLSQVIDSEDFKLFSLHDSIIDNIQKIRQHVLDPHQKFNMKKEVFDVYESLEVTNKVNDITPIYPKKLYNHFVSNRFKKLWQDEFRYLIGGLIKIMNEAYDIDQKESHFNEICNHCMVLQPGNDYRNELVIMNDYNPKKVVGNEYVTIDDPELLNALKHDSYLLFTNPNYIAAFVNSYDFMFFPDASIEVNPPSIKFKESHSSKIVEENDIYDRRAPTLRLLEKHNMFNIPENIKPSSICQVLHLLSDKSPAEIFNLFDGKCKALL